MSEERKIEIKNAGRVYQVLLNGKMVAYSDSLYEAQQYAKEYAGYKGEGLKDD